MSDCADSLGPVPRASRGMHNLVICTNAFTKNMSLYAFGRPTTDVVLKSLIDKYIPRYGHAKKILPDQGKQFQTKKLHNKLEKRDIQAILKSICRLQSNLAERRA